MAKGTQSRRVHVRAAALLSAASMVVLGTFAAPAALAGGADMKVSGITVSGVGKPAHVVVDAAGKASGFYVRVATTNVGNTPSRPSHTFVKAKFPDSVVVIIGSIAVPRLKPHQSHSQILTVEEPFTRLGFATVEAEANGAYRMPEGNRRNNLLKGPVVAVIARSWLVSEFKDFTTIPGEPSQVTSASPGFEFEFHQYSAAHEKYEYVAKGEVKSVLSGSSLGGICTVSGEGAASHSPWPSESSLFIDKTLTQYQGLVYAAEEPKFSAPFTCNGQLVPGNMGGFANLVTEVGGHLVVPMEPDEERLKDSYLTARYGRSWNLYANIPGGGTSP